MTPTLETFDNQFPGRDYTIEIVCPEFTSVCPKTGQPDFGTIVITYVPAALCIELKSLKLYMWSYRNEGAFHEKVTNKIADDLIRVLDPRRFRIEGRWNIRGGIGTIVTIEHSKQAS